MAGAKDLLSHFGSVIASLVFFWAIFQQYFPHHLRSHIEKYSQRIISLVYPYIQITFNETTGERFMRSEAYVAIENYLSSNSSKQAKRLKADMLRNNQSLSVSMDEHEEVGDEYKRVKVWWAFGKNVSKQPTFSFHPVADEKRYYKLTFHKKNRDLIMDDYLSYVLKEGNAIKIRNRQRKLYTNNGAQWSHVVFEHPASFETLAMEPAKKEEIIEDLVTFSKGEEFYSRIGRAWKRGYLLYGPPGTGKSTMIAAMANLLNYDIYDLELTAVKDNTELRRLLIETSSKSIIVIEDIDCSRDLTGQRKKKPDKEVDNIGGDEKKKAMSMLAREEQDASTSKVTLSGLLNFIDGLWSACGGERLIVFTTNHVHKLDPALIRRGRMDKHVELSYCGYESFKILAKNYLRIDSHHLFPTIQKLLDEIQMTPADVAENLMPKTASADATSSIQDLVATLQSVKQEAEQIEVGQ
ncbi:AAA-ATPase ASD, mitochondrial-like [Chenopodium quinoa]|uniref:AAA-ATPase ASD, mitochondrial-like n=1 Tax=Chenopodium quinoa TaxID=63459 RepID=UPI000B7763C3|nr:AAA-ATPase ASD, mitochondrial-like [Chenopodium quinoa]